MGKLYLFGVGGTGARAIKAFTMLSAAGVTLEKCSKVIPILIDPDTSNGDLITTVELLRHYRKIHAKIAPVEIGFFKTEIATLASLATENAAFTINDSFDFKLGDTVNKSFQDFINLYGMEFENQLLLKLLYSDKNFQDSLTKGFLGNPNVGSIVLNKLRDSAEFNFFGSTFDEGDRIFIISSIFGGTGAAGFPLLLKNFRNAQSVAGSESIRNAKIGGVSVLPYFAVMNDEKSSIDSNNFITKSKAALSYYATNINNLNALYYIGDSEKKNYDNIEGGATQKNDAHVAEMIAALSVFHFMKMDDNDLPNNSTKYFEYALNTKDVSDPIETFDQLGMPTKILCGKNFVQFYLFSYFYKNFFTTSLTNDWAKDLNVTADFLGSDFHSSVNSFASSYFFPWINQLSGNKREFRPFLENEKKEDLCTFLSKKPIERKGVFHKGTLNIDDIRMKLNKMVQSKVSRGRNKESSLLNTFWNATNEIFNERLTHF